MTPKTNAERQAARTARLEAAGLKQIRNLWAHPDDEPAIRKKAESLAKSRAKGK